jgi:hypothetical protein
MRHADERDRRSRGGRVLVGLGLVLLGLALLLERLGLVGFDLVRSIWPLLLVAAGLWKLLQPGCRGTGLWLLVAGALLLLHVEQVVSLHRSWPVFVVTAGAAMIVGALDRRRPRADEGM